MTPTPAEIEEVVEYLSSKGEHRSVVQLVETWASQGVPTVAARLMVARSLLDLRQVDRAWTRIRDLVEVPEPNLDALAIAAEMFLLRGWPNQARKVLQKGLEREPHHPLLRELDERAQEPPAQVESVPDGETVPIEQLVRVAEQYMARGAMVRARALLERVRRRVGAHGRANDLLWAMDGVFLAPEPLHALCRRWGRPLDPQEEAEEPEHTENTRAEDLRPGAHGLDRAGSEPDSEDSFPQLFRNLPIGLAQPLGGPDTPLSDGFRLEASNEFDSNENTAVTSMAELLELDSAAFQERTDYGEDTQIARVMSKKGVTHVTGPVHTQVHTPVPGAPPVDTQFDLDEYRRQMGMTAAGLDSDFGGPEDEDDSVVILTGPDLPEAPTNESGPETGRVALDPLYLQDEARAKARLASSEDAWVAPQTSREPALKTSTSKGTKLPAKPARAASNPVEINKEPPRARAQGEAEKGKAGGQRDETESSTERPAPERQSSRPLGPRAGGPVLANLRAELAAVDVTAELSPDDPVPAFPRTSVSTGGIIAWPYWMAALFAVLMFSVLVFFVLAVVFAAL